jgi:RNA ligase
MRYSDYLNLSELTQAISDGYVHVQEHQELPLVIFNYTNHAQFDNAWSEVVIKCRGLIVEQDTYEVIAFCLQKFFNFSQYQHGEYSPVKSDITFSIPDEPFEIFEKQDGSMGTVFWYEDDWHVASRGSFHSEQAQWATQFLRSKDSYRDILNKSLTYVVEIIYPSNRIVVDYGDREDLALITAFNNETGEERLTEDIKLEWGWIGSVVRSFEPYSLSVEDLAELADENVQIGNDEDRTVQGTDSEGYVIRYQSGHRVKIKLTAYLRLHKVLTNCTERSIWEALAAGQTLDVFLENVPDEFHAWVVEVKDRLNSFVDNYIYEVSKTYHRIMSDINWSEDRKVFALLAKDSPYSEALFALGDQNLEKVAAAAWQACRPEATKPFTRLEI